MLKEKCCSNNVTSVGRVTGWLWQVPALWWKWAPRAISTLIYEQCNALNAHLPRKWIAGGGSMDAPGMLIIRGHQSIMCSKDNRDGRKGKHQASFRRYDMVDVIWSVFWIRQTHIAGLYVILSVSGNIYINWQLSFQTLYPSVTFLIQLKIEVTRV